MRSIVCFAIVIGVGVFASAQSAAAPPSNWLADSITRDAGSVKMHGHVTIAACSIVTADDAVANVGPDGRADANQDVQLSGNVHMKITNGVDPLR